MKIMAAILSHPPYLLLFLPDYILTLVRFSILLLNEITFLTFLKKKNGSFRYQNKRPTVKTLHTKSPLRLVITAKLIDSPHIGPV